MKKSALFSIVTLFATTFYSSAQGLYVEGAFGWNFGLGCNTELLYNDTYYEVYNTDNGSYYYSGKSENVKLNLGRGGSFGANIGYLFNDNVGVELHFSYLLGSPTNSSSSSEFNYIIGGMTQTETYTNKVQLSSSMFRLAPVFVVQTQLNKITPYAKLGPVLSFGKIILNQDQNNLGTIMIQESKLNGGIAIGLDTRLGFLYQTDGAMAYFIEVHAMGLSYAPKKGELTKYVIDGEDQMPGLTTQQREVEFVDEISYDSNTDLDPNKPDQTLAIAFPFSSIGVNVGVRIKLF